MDGVGTLTAPERVSKQAVEEHERTFMPFRAWCPYCVKARGRDRVHKKKTDEDEEAVNKVPRAAMDYFFMSEEDSKTQQESIVWSW